MIVKKSLFQYLFKLNSKYSIIGFILLISLFSTNCSKQEEPETYISIKNKKGSFRLVHNNEIAQLYLSGGDHQGVLRVAKLLQKDLEKVPGIKPEVILGEDPEKGPAVIIGTIGKSPLIDELVNSGMIDI